MGHHFGHVEDVPIVAESISLWDDLDAELPFCSLALLQVTKQIPSRVVMVLQQPLCLLAGQVFDTREGSEVQLDPNCLSTFVDPAESVRAEAVHVSEPIRSASITHQNGHLVRGLRRQPEEVPHRARVLQVSPGVSLLSVDEVGEFQRVPNEEDRRVVAGHVPVALFRVELERETCIFGEVPLGSLSVSDEPFSPATVEKRAKMGVFLPTEEKTQALVKRVRSCVTSK